MNELSLFTGAGGGLLGTMLIGFHPIGYVEWDDYCQRVIAARIRDGILPVAPIFGDIKAFIRDGYAHSYQGVVDVITAGFPCQPFSVAGKQKGADDARNMWPATAECIGIVRPRFVLLENVPGIRAYLPVVVRDLRRLGYAVSRPLILGADDVGAPHRRKRVWIVAHDADSGAKGLREQQDSVFHVAGAPQRKNNGRNGRSMDGTAEGRESCNTTAWVGDQYGPDSIRINGDDAGLCASEVSQFKEAEICGGDDPHADTERLQGGGSEQPLRHPGQLDRNRCDEEWAWSENWPEVAARLCRVAHGVAHRVDRLKCLGNGQVPICVATAFRLLLGGIRQ